jgi:hypothetical protein
VNAFRLFFSAASLAFVFGVSFGCSGNQAAVERETSNLKPLSVLYGKYLSQHRGQAPADEAALKSFAKKLDPKELEALGVKDIDSLFISARDKKPYTIVYGNNATSAPGEDVVIAYEQEGLSGKRYVATRLGRIEEVDEARFREMVPTSS